MSSDKDLKRDSTTQSKLKKQQSFIYYGYVVEEEVSTIEAKHVFDLVDKDEEKMKRKHSYGRTQAQVYLPGGLSTSDKYLLEHAPNAPPISTIKHHEDR
jgi:hypothetical protein